MVEIHQPPNVNVIDEIWVWHVRRRGWQEWAPKTEPGAPRKSIRADGFCRLRRFADGMDRGEAAKIGGMDRRTLRATRFTVSTPLSRMVRRKRTRAMMTFAALVVAAILVVSILYATFSRTR
jgi:hypothetical protein